MPFIRMFESGGELDESDESEASVSYGDVEYIDPEDDRYQDVKEEISGRARIIREALLAMKATQFAIKYDGGSDEGFSHPDTIRVDGRTLQPWMVRTPFRPMTEIGGAGSDQASSSETRQSSERQSNPVPAP